VTLRFRPEAEADLTSLLAYIAKRDPQAARRMRDRFRAQFDRLVEFPGLGMARDDIRLGLRLLPMGNYLTLFRRVPGGVEIVRIVHGARAWEDLF
jgi:toxin ParE1/3/4